MKIAEYCCMQQYLLVLAVVVSNLGGGARAENPHLPEEYCDAAASAADNGNAVPDYLIVGAGGAGLQMALYMRYRPWEGFSLFQNDQRTCQASLGLRAWKWQRRL